MSEALAEAESSLGFHPDRLRHLDDVLQADVDARKIPGAVVLLSRHDKVQYWKAFGYRDREANVAMQRDDIFRIASMTKPVTSVATMMLAERGHLFVPEPVAKYLPEFAETQVGVESSGAGGKNELTLVPQQRPMTIQDLLRHTAGLTYGLFGDSLVKSAYNEAGVFNLAQTNAEMVTKLAALPLAHQPGRVWDYSMATDVLGRLVEVVSGQTLDGFFQQEIFRPLGMAETGFLLPAGKSARMAQPQVDAKTGQRTPMADHTIAWPWMSGGAGLYSTAGDYLQFCRMLLNRGQCPGETTEEQLLAPSTIELMTSDHIAADVAYDPVTPVLFEAEAPTREMGQSFGLGFALRTHPGLNPLPGEVGDYYWAGALGTYFWIDPKNDLIAIFMSQAPEFRLHYRYMMRQLVYQALKPL